jgi:hypothetical protein
VKAARILVIFCLASAALGAGQTQKTATKPDVFLVTIDTLRADHVHCYGYESIQTPALDGLAKDGIRFTHAFTPSPITNTSHTSILTGLLPSSHGVTDFAVPLSATHPTLATLLKTRGYHTAAFVSGFPLDRRFGFDRGFDTYDDRMAGGGIFEHQANLPGNRCVSVHGRRLLAGWNVAEIGFRELESTFAFDVAGQRFRRVVGRVAPCG